MCDKPVFIWGIAIAVEGTTGAAEIVSRTVGRTWLSRNYRSTSCVNDSLGVDPVCLPLTSSGPSVSLEDVSSPGNGPGLWLNLQARWDSR
jgi:hypothetical protein